MIRPRLEDHVLVASYTGRVVVGVGMLMSIPLATALLFGEWEVGVDFGIGILTCIAIGLSLQTAFRTRRELRRRHGLVVVSVSWLVVTVLGAIPFWLSGHMSSLLNAVFDVMSGLTTTGLYLIEDLDHVSYGLSMWRFVLTYAGGMGIVVIALTFLFRGTVGAYQLYVGEGKEERLLPNVIHTARAIGSVSLAWLVVGTITLSTIAVALGQPPVRALLHGLWVFMGGFSTGGFAPQSFNTFWYHSPAFEAASIAIFVAGSLNFALHWALWRGERAEIRRNIEVVSFAMTFVVLFAVVSTGLARAGIYPDAVVFFRKAFYLLASAHTTTGFGTIYSRTFVVQWGPVAMLGVIAAMVIGASACSTAGGIKGFRIGVITKVFVEDIRRMVSPDSAVITERYHHIRKYVLSEHTVRSVLTITVAFLTMHSIMTLVGVMNGYPVIEAAFEGASAASNTGLSCGVLSPTMPGSMRVVYTVAMWLGRMEFLSVFALVGWGIAMVRGR
ncbi:MAG: TrkH family potassium uptake protein [Coriobacteriia bacterium]|nr:TrkH family potassium uptake protein [Coriobacteriia bacterium]